MLGHTVLRGVEERGAESKSDRPTHHDQVEVEQIANRRDTAPHESARADHDVVRRLGRRAPGDGFDRRTRRFGLETSTRAAYTPPTVWLDDHVSDVPGVSGGTVEKLAIDHDAAADTSGDHHRHEVATTLGCANPTLGKRQSLRIEIAIHRKQGHLLKALPKREVAPHPNVER